MHARYCLRVCMRGRVPVRVVLDSYMPLPAEFPLCCRYVRLVSLELLNNVMSSLTVYVTAH